MNVETPLETAFEGLKRVLSVETLLETDFEGLKRVLNVETGLEVLFEGANAKVHVHAILGLGKKITRQIDGRNAEFIIYSPQIYRLCCQRERTFALRRFGR